MVNFGPLAAEIVSLVWGTPANFSGFRVLAALLHDTLVVGVSQTAAFNRGRHLYSAAQPSRWALAHISSWLLTVRVYYFYSSPSRSQEATRMWANAQRDGRPAEHRWRPLFNAAKFG